MMLLNCGAGEDSSESLALPLGIPGDRADTSCSVSLLWLAQDQLVLFTELSCRNTIEDVDKVSYYEARGPS